MFYRRRGFLARGRVWATEAAKLTIFAVTCSIDAAISLVEELSCSAETAIESACVAVSWSEAVSSFAPLTAASSVCVCACSISRNLIGKLNDRFGFARYLIRLLAHALAVVGSLAASTA